MDHAHLSLLEDIALAIVFAAVAGQLARLLRQPTILGYVLGGVALGAPLGLGLVTQAESIELISEMGLIFLLFIIGLEIQLPELAKLGRSTLVVGCAQFLGCVALGLALFAPFAAGGGRFTLLYLAVSAALSSTLIVVKLLHDKAEIHTAAGRLTIGILVLQDLFAIVFMAVQPSLADPQVATLVRALVYGAALVGLAFLASRHLLSRLMRASAKVPELVLLTAIAWCFAVSKGAQAAGLSREMGALVAGMSIAAFPYGADVTAKLAGIRDFFVTLFFVSLGLKLAAPTLGTLKFSLLTVAIVAATRLVTIVPSAWLAGQGLRTGFVAALNLAQVSEFSLVILALGVGYGHVTAELQNAVLPAMLLAAVVSSYLITFNDPLARALVGAARRLGVRERGGAAAEGGGGHGGGRDIVLLGCFREGLALLERIEAERPDLCPRILVIDFNPALKPRLEAAGFAWAYGDLAHPETLSHLGLAAARTIVSTIPDSFLKGTSNRRLVLHAKQISPWSQFIVVAEDERAAVDLREIPATDVVVPAAATAERMLGLLEARVGRRATATAGDAPAAPPA
ncbi:MAG: cation:proton antiporter [Thermoanaerobaculia bacterium]|nr:cation:proton antiporter [Thermoanaerobaculia bacterium]